MKNKVKKGRNNCEKEERKRRKKIHGEKGVGIAREKQRDKKEKK